MRNSREKLSTGVRKNIKEEGEDSGLTKASACVGIPPTSDPKTSKRVTDVPPICAEGEEDTLPEGTIPMATLVSGGGR